MGRRRSCTSTSSSPLVELECFQLLSSLEDLAPVTSRPCWLRQLLPHSVREDDQEADFRRLLPLVIRRSRARCTSAQEEAQAPARLGSRRTNVVVSSSSVSAMRATSRIALCHGHGNSAGPPVCSSIWWRWSTSTGRYTRPHNQSSST